MLLALYNKIYIGKRLILIFIQGKIKQKLEENKNQKKVNSFERFLSNYITINDQYLSNEISI